MKKRVLKYLRIFYGLSRPVFFYIFIKTTYDFRLQPHLITDYIILRLLQNFKLKELMKPLLHYLERIVKKKFLVSYKIILTGRVTRKDRAMYY